MTEPKPYTLKNGVTKWRVQFRPTPGANPTTERFSTPESAWKFIGLGEKYGWDVAVRARNAADKKSQGSMSLEKAFDKYIAQKRKITTGTKDGYHRMARQSWLPFMGHLPISAITDDDVDDWIEFELAKTVTRGKNKGEPVTGKTVRNRHCVLSQTLEWAVDKGWIPRNPARGREILDNRERPDGVYIEPTEFDQIIPHVRTQYQLFTRFLYTTGERWGEATAAKVKDLLLDLKVPIVRVRRSWKEGPNGSRYLGPPKSNAGIRDLPLAQDVAAGLRELTNGMAPEDFIFTSITGRRLRAPWFRANVWTPALEASGLTIRPRVHDLRHSYISNLVVEGVPLHVVQEYAGHESLETTRRVYAHLDSRAGEKVAAAAQNSLTPPARSASPVLAMLEGASGERQQEILSALSVLMKAA